MKKIKIISSAIGYDLAADDYDKKESYLNSFEKNRFLPLLGDVKNKIVLDVGAGTGRLAMALAQMGAQVTALDLSPKMLAELHKKNPKIITVVGDAESLPFSENSFDFIIASFLIVHLKNPAIFFAEAYRALKDGGKLLVSNINQKEPPEIKTKEGIIKIESYYHQPKNIIKLLEELAFAVEKEIFVYENDLWVNQIILAQK
jgi:ubiquinone/menaquinone biosynthesis C-methylase UbiE